MLRQLKLELFATLFSITIIICFDGFTQIIILIENKTANDSSFSSCAIQLCNLIYLANQTYLYRQAQMPMGHFS